MKNHIFWSEIGSGLENRAAHPHSKFRVSSPGHYRLVKAPVGILKMSKIEPPPPHPPVFTSYQRTWPYYTTPTYQRKRTVSLLHQRSCIVCIFSRITHPPSVMIFVMLLYCCCSAQKHVNTSPEAEKLKKLFDLLPQKATKTSGFISLK